MHDAGSSKKAPRRSINLKFSIYQLFHVQSAKFLRLVSEKTLAESALSLTYLSYTS
jgi:hypothetical protein